MTFIDDDTLQVPAAASCRHRDSAWTVATPERALAPAAHAQEQMSLSLELHDSEYEVAGVAQAPPTPSAEQAVRAAWGDRSEALYV